MRPANSHRKTARGIVIHDGKVLLMERWRTDEHGRKLHYFSVPGGGIDPGESAEVAVVRELFEEMHIVVRPREILATLHDDRGAQHTIFRCDYLSGTPHLSPDSPEALRAQEHHNRYKPHWIDSQEFATVELNEIYNPLRPTIHELLR